MVFLLVILIAYALDYSLNIGRFEVRLNNRYNVLHTIPDCWNRLEDGCRS
jgi:hypothetical protein